MENIQDLLRALEEWEAADDRANEAAAALTRPGPLGEDALKVLRTLEQAAAEKLELVRRSLALDFEPSVF